MAVVVETAAVAEAAEQLPAVATAGRLTDSEFEPSRLVCLIMYLMVAQLYHILVI